MVFCAGNSSTVAEAEGPAVKIARGLRVAQQAELVGRFLWPGRLQRIGGLKDRPRLDIGLALGEGVKHILRQTEIEREHFLGGHVDPVGDRKGPVFRKCAIVERQNEMAGLVADCLDRMAVALGEIPKIARLKIVDLHGACGIDDHGLAPSGNDEGPFRRDRVPVQFARGARVEIHVDAGDFLADRELMHGRFLGPTARRDLGFVAVEREFEVRAWRRRPWGRDRRPHRPAAGLSLRARSRRRQCSPYICRSPRRCW